jgi:hypothetical protein
VSPRGQASTVLRRYLPLGVAVAVQLLLIGLLPSTAGPTTTVSSGSPDFVSPYAGSSPGPGGAAAPVPAAGATAAPAAPGSLPAPGAAQAGAQTATGPGPGAGAGAGAGAVPVADTRHCVLGRQFDPAIDYFAPPCVATVGRNATGATYSGVTGKTIKIVNYYPQGNAAVDASEKLQGLYVSIAQQRQWDAAAQDFINSHYELYGRKVSIATVQGTCGVFPPDTACLRNEMHAIVAAEHPFMFRWITPLTSAPFDELSSMGVINVGGLMFTDSFSKARRPYHWDVHESGTKVADAFGQLWCSSLRSSPAAYSPATGKVGSVNGSPRVLGIIGTNDPENILMRQEVDRVLHTCGSSVAHTYDASNDISTAAAQKSAAIAAMRSSPSATTVLCLCNPVGASYVYQEEQQDSYYPENLVAGTVYIDNDDSGQSFMTGTSCPNGTGCEFRTAVGLSSTEPREPVGQDVATRVWHAAGRTGAVPFAGVSLDWDYYSLMATLLQGAGPALTPTHVEQGAFATPARGGGTTGHALRGFSPGDYAWNQDMVRVYWDAKRTSRFNGLPGTFVAVGSRITLGHYPTGPPPFPANR